MSIEVFPNQDPRIALVPIPDGNQITMQDYSDQLKEWAQQPANMSYPFPVKTTGKEDLGGGVLVGITVEANNIILGFDQRPTSVASGNCTSSSSGTLLIDTTADFVTANIQPGAYILNITDESVGTCILRISNTELLMLPLGDGADNSWDINDGYKIWQPTECEASGGNLVGIDENGTQINAFFPTFGTYVVRTSSSSATLQEQADIRFASYNGGVTVDTVNGVSGTLYPTGTPRQPSNNMEDALSIINEVGLTKFFINTSITVNSGLDYSRLQFQGLSRTFVTITVNADANVQNCEFRNAEIAGTLDGGSELILCNISALDYVNGVVKECTIDGPITLGGPTSTEAIFIDTNSGIAGLNKPTIDCGGDGPQLQMRGHSGGVLITNKTGAANCSIEMEQGNIEIDATVNNGIIVCRGISTLTDNSTGSADVRDFTVNNNTIAAAVWNALLTAHTVPGSFGERIQKILTKIQSLYFN